MAVATAADTPSLGASAPSGRTPLSSAAVGRLRSAGLLGSSSAPSAVSIATDPGPASSPAGATARVPLTPQGLERVRGLAGPGPVRDGGLSADTRSRLSSRIASLADVQRLVRSMTTGQVAPDWNWSGSSPGTTGTATETTGAATGNAVSPVSGTTPEASFALGQLGSLSPHMPTGIVGALAGMGRNTLGTAQALGVESPTLSTIGNILAALSGNPFSIANSIGRAFGSGPALDTSVSNMIGLAQLPGQGGLMSQPGATNNIGVTAGRGFAPSLSTASTALGLRSDPIGALNTALNASPLDVATGANLAAVNAVAGALRADGVNMTQSQVAEAMAQALATAQQQVPDFDPTLGVSFRVDNGKIGVTQSHLDAAKAENLTATLASMAGNPAAVAAMVANLSPQQQAQLAANFLNITAAQAAELNLSPEALTQLAVNGAAAQALGYAQAGTNISGGAGQGGSTSLGLGFSLHSDGTITNALGQKVGESLFGGPKASNKEDNPPPAEPTPPAEPNPPQEPTPPAEPDPAGWPDAPTAPDGPPGGGPPGGMPDGGEAD